MQSSAKRDFEITGRWEDDDAKNSARIRRQIWLACAAMLLVFSSGARQRADFRQRGEDRRPDRSVRPGGDRDRPGFGHRRANGGRRFRRHGSGQADHGDFRRPSDQARHRRRHRPAVVRSRSGRPDRRRAGLGRGPGGAERRQRKEEALHHPFDRHGRFPRQVLLALHHAMGVRHPRACRRHRAGGRQARRQYLVLPDRRLRLRPFARARRHRR